MESFLAYSTATSILKVPPNLTGLEWERGCVDQDGEEGWVLFEFGTGKTCVHSPWFHWFEDSALLIQCIVSTDVTKFILS